jgi:hypothetical protein
MKSSLLWLVAGLALLSSAGTSLLQADGAKPTDNDFLVDFKKDSSKDSISYAAGGAGTLDTQAGVIKLTVPAGNGYPGIKFADPSGFWDLTGYTGVEVEVVNTGTDTIKLSLRVDADGPSSDNPWDGAMETVGPGETKMIHVTFGESFGKPGYAVPPDHVVRVLLFAFNPEAAGTITINALRATK